MSINRRTSSPRFPHGGLALIRYLVSSGDYYLTEKVEEAIEDGECSLEDIEHCVATGFVHKKEKDDRHESADCYKYTILGRDCGGKDFYCVGKIMKFEGKSFLVITAHRQERS